MGLRRLNFLDPPELVVDESEPEGYRAGAARLGPGIGAEKLGATVYELPQDAKVCPYHYEYPEEEWLFVLEGTPTVRHPGGEDELAPGDVVCFVAGPDGAHQVLNRAAATARVMMLSTHTHPAICVYPDSDKIATFTGGADDGMFRRASSVDYFDGES